MNAEQQTPFIVLRGLIESLPDEKRQTALDCLTQIHGTLVRAENDYMAVMDKWIEKDRDYTQRILSNHERLERREREIEETLSRLETTTNDLLDKEKTLEDALKAVKAEKARIRTNVQAAAQITASYLFSPQKEGKLS